MRGNGRIFQRGSIWWVAYYHQGRERRESSTSRDRKEAVRMLRQRIGEIAAGALHTPRPKRAKMPGGMMNFPQTDYLLNVDEIATRLGKSTRWIRDNVDTLDFAFKLGQEHRFSARALDEWIKEQLPTKMGSALPPEKEAT